MSKQRLKLAGSEKARTKVNQKAIDKFVRGEMSFVEALGVSDEVVQDLRRQAIALYGSGKYEDCIDVVLGLSALDNIHPVDPLLLAHCYTKLGDVTNAELCTAHYERLMKVMA